MTDVHVHSGHFQSAVIRKQMLQAQVCTQV